MGDRKKGRDIILWYDWLGWFPRKGMWCSLPEKKEKKPQMPESLPFAMCPGGVNFSHLCTVRSVWQILCDLCHKRACLVYIREHTSVLCDNFHPIFYFNFLFLSNLPPNFLWSRMATQITKNAWFNIIIENNKLFYVSLDVY